MSTELPIRLIPETGEALESYLRRTTVANGLSRSPFPPPPDRTSEMGPYLQQLALAVGQPPTALLDLTLSRFPQTIHGSPRRNLGGWRTDQYRWRCPECTTRTGVFLRDWGLAMDPLCLGCHTILVTHGEERALPPDPALEDFVTKLLTWADQTRTSKHSRSKLKHLRRLITLVAQTVDNRWPLTNVTTPAAVWEEARLWGRRPAPSPRAVAALLGAVMPFTASPTTQRKVIEEGWTRLRDRPGTGLPVPAAYLPEPDWRPPRHSSRPQAPSWASRDQDRLQQLRGHLQELAAATGLAGAHVPSLLFLPDEHPLPPAEAWPSRQTGARVLHLLLTGASLGPAQRTRTGAVLGYRSDPHQILAYPDGVGRGVGGILAKQLRQAASLLVEAGLTDYQRRRQIFAAHIPAPVGLPRRLPAPSQQIETARLVWGWLWVHFTRGTLQSSPHPDLDTTLVLTFDALLDPEQRLLLHEHGQAWIDTVESLPHPQLVPLAEPAANLVIA